MLRFSATALPVGTETLLLLFHYSDSIISLVRVAKVNRVRRSFPLPRLQDAPSLFAGLRVYNVLLDHDATGLSRDRPIRFRQQLVLSTSGGVPIPGNLVTLPLDCVFPPRSSISPLWVMGSRS